MGPRGEGASGAFVGFGGNRPTYRMGRFPLSPKAHRDFQSGSIPEYRSEKVLQHNLS